MKSGRIITCLTMMIAASMVLHSCSDDSSPTGVGGSKLIWEAVQNPEVPEVYSYWLSGVCGTAFGDVFVVGRGMVLHHDDQDWTMLYNEEAGMLNDVWGTLNNLYVVGDEGTILHYDGSSWQRMDSGTSASLLAIWGAGSDIFAVGEGGTALHYRRGRWRVMDTRTDDTLHDVGGTGGGDVVAVGDNGTILELVGDVARRMDSGTTNDLHGIAGNSKTGLCAVGAMGTILRFDGSRWHGVRSGTISDFESVCATTDGHLFAGGRGWLAHYDGRSWQVDEASVGHNGIWGSTSENVLAVGGDKVWRFDGTAWGVLELPNADPVPYSALRDVWCSSGTDVYAVGGPSLHFDGTEWREIDGFHAAAVWGRSENDVFAIRTDSHVEWDPWGGGRREWTVGSVFGFHGTDWTLMQSFQHMSFSGIWGDFGNDLFVAGSRTQWTATGGGGVIIEEFKSYPRIFRYTSGAWSEVYALDTEGLLNDVWGTSNTDVYAVGSGGLIVHWDGTSGTEMSSGTTASLLAVWGSSDSDVFAVGTDGTIVHYDGTRWEPMSAGTASTLNDVWGAAVGDIHVAGDNGTLLHYDGTRWRAQASPTTHGLYGIWGSAADDIFAVGAYGTILRYRRR